MVYYLAIKGTKSDAMTFLQVRDVIGREEADESTLAWRDGLESWKPLGEFSEFAEYFARSPNPDEEVEGELNRGGTAGDGKSTDPAGGRVGDVRSSGRPLPWMRLFARGIDVIFLLFFFELISSFLVPDLGKEIAESLSARFLANLVMILAGCLLEALLLSTWGSTPGKWLFRIRVRRALGGEHLTYKLAFQRSLLVWVKGLALMFVWITPITMMFAHARLMVFGTTSWDRDLGLSVSQERPGQVQLVVAFAIYAAFAFLLYHALLFHLEQLRREEEGGSPKEEELRKEREDGVEEYPENFT